MKKRRFKSVIVSLMYILSVVMLLGGLYFVEGLISNSMMKNEDNYEVVDVISEDSVPEVELPVVAVEPVIRRPYNDGNVKIVKNYYDYQGEESVQEDSLVYYGNTYMQNSGVDYGMESEFEVVSVLDGTVMEVNEDEVMGKTIKIQHNKDLVSVYQSLGSVDVKVNDTVFQGSIIGKSGLSNVSRDLGNHLHFEIYYQGAVVNPESCYDKTVAELK